MKDFLKTSIIPQNIVKEKLKSEGAKDGRLGGLKCSSPREVMLACGGSTGKEKEKVRCQF